MSIIQKLENSYVAILRVVIIIFATILLVGAVGLVVLSLMEKFGAAPTGNLIKVDPKDVLTAVLPAASAPAAQEDSGKGRKQQAEYDKAYAMVSAFVQKHSGGTENVDKEVLFATLDSTMARLDEPGLQEAYIAGWNETMSAGLKDRRILERAAKLNTPAATATPVAPVQAEQVEADAVVEAGTEEDVTDDAATTAPQEMSEEVEASVDTAFAIVEELADNYSRLFMAKYGESLVKQATGDSGKLGSMTYMIAAASIFVSFLCVIFLTVTIRIERNLREIAYRPVAEIRPAAM